MLIVDANVLVSAAIGRSRTLLRDTVERGVDLLVTDAALIEVRRVLIRLSVSRRVVDGELEQFAALMLALDAASYAPFEPAARARLHPRAQPDWPTLAAALAFGADIWSNDRDFFGTGVAVWSTRNVGHTNAA